ncbi:MAG: hypothetical protein JWM74_3344 [Myxococcaceae bacterium]|nr:hypothetical protein [Myxococcaceae bacterium]
MSDTNELQSTDEQALRDLQMWAVKLGHLENVRVGKRSSRQAPSSIAVPAHSESLFAHLAAQSLEWEATDGSGHRGAVGIGRSPWIHQSPSYNFDSHQHAMIVDTHNDQAMAFLVYGKGQSVDEASVVAAAAGEEGEATFVADSAAAYIRKAVDARFASYWFLQPDQAKKTRAWVDAQPIASKPTFEVEIESVEPADALTLRVALLEWMPERERKSIATAAGYAKGDALGLAKALENVLTQGKPPAVKKLQARLEKAASKSTWRAHFFLDPIDPTLRAVRMHATRVSTAYLMHDRFIVSTQALQLLLDAPGAEALSRAVNTDHVRFCPTRKFDEATKVALDGFAKQPAKTVPRGKVLGHLSMLVLLPAELVPKGCKPGARFDSIAPATDGVVMGKTLPSV